MQFFFFLQDIQNVIHYMAYRLELFEMHYNIGKLLEFVPHFYKKRKKMVCYHLKIYVEVKPFSLMINHFVFNPTSGGAVLRSKR